MSFGISSILTEVLARLTGPEEADLLQFQAVGGGSINNAYHIITQRGRHWFCKINDAQRFPDLFVLEKQGLDLLETTNMVRVPEVVGCELIAGKQVLIMEWIEEGPRSPRFWTEFGQRLAQLHSVTNPCFGLASDNYMGALPQSNKPSTDWVEFFRDRRLQPQLDLALRNGLMDSKEMNHFQGLFGALDTIFGKEPPSLLHGDLWGGNFLSDKEGLPVLIDPAVYFGHRSMDLAMTTLFGGFEKRFYEAYEWHYPFPPDHRQQWDICNLYPLLIHLNLFGKSYMGNILHTIQRF